MFRSPIRDGAVPKNVRPAVMIVDEEDMVITSLRTFLSLETDYQIYGFPLPEEAAQFLETHPLDVVVSDYLMPKRNGLDLLAKAKQCQPEAARVLLTGHAGKQSAIERTTLLRPLKEKITALDAAHSSLKDTQARLLHAFL